MDKASGCIVPVHIFRCPFQAPPISASGFSTVLFQAYILLGSPKYLIKKIKKNHQSKKYMSLQAFMYLNIPPHKYTNSYWFSIKLSKQKHYLQAFKYKDNAYISSHKHRFMNYPTIFAKNNSINKSSNTYIINNDIHIKCF